MTVRGVAERFAVTEAQIARWRDIFEIAGMLALSNVLSGQSSGPRAQRRTAGTAQRSEPTTKRMHGTTTNGPGGTTHGPDSTTPGLRGGGKARSKSKMQKRYKRTRSKKKR
jgi:hypothetical protein